MAEQGTQKQRKGAKRQQRAGASDQDRLSVVDFSRPARFKPEVRHRIAAALRTFGEGLALKLETDLKSEVAVAVGELAEHTWASARAQLPADSLAVAVHQEGDAPSLMLNVELPLLLAALECLLGGQPGDAPAQRSLSEVDWTLSRGLLDTVVGELSPTWADLGGTALARGELDLEGDAGLAYPVAESTLLIAIEVQLVERSAASTMALLIPWPSARAIAHSIGGAHAAPQTPEQGAERLRRGLNGAPVLLRAEVGSVEMAAERMIELAPGSVLALQQRAEDGVLLFAEGVSVGRGRPGRSGARRAIKLETTDEAPVRAATYATLGRAELQRARAELSHGLARGAGGTGILRSLFVRVWAELGRTHLELGHTLELRSGTVVELDQGADAPVELFANGLCFASGKLVVTGEGAWGVLLDELV